ncbi:MAG: hypothetical protein AB8H86_18475 [Polyangiales bacterium]
MANEGKPELLEHNGRSLTPREWAAEFEMSVRDFDVVRQRGIPLADLEGGWRADPEWPRHVQWNHGKVLRLRDLHARGDSIGQLSRLMGCTVGSVVSKLRGLGLL